MTAINLPDTVIAIKQAPHDRLFPHMAAVVHHGGAGTTAAALRAGIPQVIIPFFGDQPFWGRKIHQHQLGPAAIPHQKLNRDNLSQALEQATQSDTIKQQAKHMGRKIRQEKGIQNAIDFIDTYTQNAKIKPMP